MSDVRKTTESLPYHSPERVRGGQISPSDDVWAVAATLYTALTAAPPFVGASDAELKQQVLRGSPAPLSVYGVDDERLERLMGMSFAADAGRRLSNVALFRRELERFHPAPAGLDALEDEEVGDEDQAATAMLAIAAAGGPGSKPADSKLFAPPSFQADSRVAAEPTGGDFDTNPPPPAAGDATVMRELPAHIMAMAARAAAGSNPPPAEQPKAAEPPAPVPPSAPRPGAAPPSAPKPLSAPRVPQFGSPAGAPPGQSLAATVAVATPAPRPPAPTPQLGPRPGFAPPRMPSNPPDKDPDDVRTVMHAGDVRSLLEGANAAALPPPGANPFGPASPPRPQAPQPPQPPGRPQAPIPPAGMPPRPMPPAPPGVRQPAVTNMGLGAPAIAAPPAPPAAPPVAPTPPPAAALPTTTSLEEEDEDDGARTVMRESPILSPLQMAPRPAAGAAPAPAAARPSQEEPTQSEFLAEPSFIVENSFSGAAPPNVPRAASGPMGGAPQAPQQPWSPAGPQGFQATPPPTGAGVSALIAEALDTGAPNNAGAEPTSPLGAPDASPQMPGFGGGMGGGAAPGFGGGPGFGAPNAPGFGGAGAPGFGSAPAFPNAGNPYGQPAPGFPGMPGDPSAAPPAANPYGAGPPFPTGEPTTSGPAIKLKQGRSYGSLVLICILVLVLAAAVTFIVLKYKDKLGLGSSDPAPAPATTWLFEPAGWPSDPAGGMVVGCSPVDPSSRS